ncbi:MAG: phosphate ABC transporter permease subunit PstC [Planctomycetota bacterium]
MSTHGPIALSVKRERAVRSVLFACAALSIFTTLAVVVMLTTRSATFFSEDGVTLTGFLFGDTWNPFAERPEDRAFGVLPLVGGTMLIAAISACISLPLGLLTAVYLSEYAHPRVRTVLKPVLEILAGIPTVVYGFFAIVLITPLLRVLLPDLRPFNALSAGIAVGIMCLPIVTSLSEDALRSVPRSLREGAFAVGGTRFDVTCRVVVPAALSGIVAAFLLALSRAVGETMIVALAAGMTPNLTLDPTDSVQTMTGFIIKTVKGESEAGSIQRKSIFAVGALLFLITLAFTIVGNRVLAKFREAYE